MKSGTSSNYYLKRKKNLIIAIGIVRYKVYVHVAVIRLIPQVYYVHLVLYVYIYICISFEVIIIVERIRKSQKQQEASNFCRQRTITKQFSTFKFIISSNDSEEREKMEEILNTTVTQAELVVSN